jgi:hypothetical protein
MTPEFKTFYARILKAKTLADLLKLDSSLDRLWVEGFFTAMEFAKLDNIIFSRKMKIEDPSTSKLTLKT